MKTLISFAPLRLFFALFFFCALSFSAQTGRANAPSAARQTLENAISHILDTLKNPAYANPATRQPLRQQIEKEVKSIFDFSEFSSRTVGPRWKTFSPEEKRNFSDAFANLLFNTYLNKITGYNGEQAIYTGEVSSPDGKLVEVRTAIALSDGRRIPVSYRMLLKDGQWRVYDVIIENISLVKNYRTQFQDILNSASPQQLIDRINSRTKEVIAQGEADAKNK